MASEAYIHQIVKTVEAYKDVRDSIEKMFDHVDRFPNTSLSSLGDGSESDRENLKKKREVYKWSTEGNYPPHLKCVPTEAEVVEYKIFDMKRVPTGRTQEETAQKAKAVIGQFFGPLRAQAAGDGRLSMSAIEKTYQVLHKTAIETKQEGVYSEPNVGLRSDWYTDAVFAQQHFTGVNPTGLKQASEDWVAGFAQVAKDQDNTAAHQLISTYPASLYVVDNSDYRYILGLAPDTTIRAADIPKKGLDKAGNDAFGCSSVTLFTLSDTGKLHPVAICIDYKGSLNAAKSVTIFNKRLTPYAPTDGEGGDWPWRYAKMCSMVSDWTRHELAVHLTETHLVEEAIIVAAQRTLPDSHVINQLLHPHWYKTLSLNFLARLKLVPDFIAKVAPFETDLVKSFVHQSYMNFDFTGRYAPTDLKNRGFDPARLDDKKFHNYLYARNISKCWEVLRSFVSDVLSAEYTKGDAQVRADKYVANFCAEMRSQQGGQLLSFPVVKTLEELIDMVTMCIHIAAPQHNAINYLQQYYLSFVPNRPGSLSAPLPNTIQELQGYTEDHLITSLPLVEGSDVIEWTLMAQVPYLLSAEVDPENNIEGYAATTQVSENENIAKAGLAFTKKIRALKGIFDKYNKEMDDKITEYHVLDPKVIAQSILI